MPDKSSIPALLFAGNFNYNLAGANPEEVIAKLKKGIDDWQSDLSAFQEVVNQRFLAQQQPASLFPAT